MEKTQAGEVAESPVKVQKQDGWGPPSSSPSDGRSPSESFPYFHHHHHHSPASPEGPTPTDPRSDFGPLSPCSPDIVYPIRSVVGISPPRQSSPVSPPPAMHRSAGSSSAGSSMGEVLSGERSRSRSRPRKAFTGSSVAPVTGGGVPLGNFGGTPTSGQSSSPSTPGESEGSEGMLRSASESADKALGGQRDGISTDRGYVTARFKHLVTDEGHMVVTGVSGSEGIQRCGDEPIHIPGAVQGFGVLIAFREDMEGILAVKIASENSEYIIGYSPAALFSLDSFHDVFSSDQAEELDDHLEYVRSPDHDPVKSGPKVFSLTMTAPDSTKIKLHCALHISDKNPGLVLCEFELQEDHLYPLFSPPEGAVPPEDTLNSDPSQEEFLESTSNSSKPLRVVRQTRARKAPEKSMEIFDIVGQIEEQLSAASSLDMFLKVLVGIIKEVTKFHRVMIYQFDEVWNGQVVTELVDPLATKDLYKGLHFPASDIPKQARDLYLINKVRLLYDRDQVTARLVCKSKEYLDSPLDMTHSYLRAMSPIHVKYLENMAVRASMSISLTAFGKLWGLISCHSYGQKGMRVSFPARKMCRLVGESASRHIENLSYASRLQARKLINATPTEKNPGGYIVASSDDLLKLFDADFGLLSIREETKVLGRLEHSREALAMLEYLRMRKFTSVLTSQNLGVEFPDLDYEPGFTVIAGLLLVPLSFGGQDFIVFFRKGQLWEVNWAGNPYEKNLKEGTKEYLEPRKSFKIWSETVVGKCRDWTEEQIETAAVLCLVYGKFIEVWRQKEAAAQTSQLTRLLLANASHELRTPLNAIINYLEIALEGPLDNETRDNLMRSHSASKSLIYVINDLLDLTRTEEGQNLIMEEAFDLSETVRGATEMYKADADRKNITFEVIEYEGLPKFVKGDQARLRQAISNIAGNAVKHTSEGGVKVEVWVLGVMDGRCQVEIAIQDTGVGMSSDELETLFQEFEQVHTEEDTISCREGRGNESPRYRSTFNAVSKFPRQNILGLGLAVVARTVRNMNGQLRLKSEQGKGSRFTISLPLLLVPEAELDSGKGKTVTERREPPSAPPPAVTPPGEILFVDVQDHRSHGMLKGSSGARVNSLGSLRSGENETDRLAQAISAPLLTSTPNGSPGRPSASVCSKSFSGTIGLVAPQRQPGQEVIETSVVPIQALRAPDDNPGAPSEPTIDGVPQMRLPHATNPSSPIEPQGRFEVLVAEDDPINSKIIKKRLETMGHGVVLTVNGEECAELYLKQGQNYDIILMDMQMPIMDGGTSATRIRQFEGADPNRPIPEKHRANGRVPIIAVSASLVEGRRTEYIRYGFDGWILKPVDFKRLKLLLDGIRDPAIRKSAAYEPEQWERGGWFSETPRGGGERSPPKHEDISPAALGSAGKAPDEP